MSYDPNGYTIGWRDICDGLAARGDLIVRSIRAEVRPNAKVGGA
jgi:hypothetical protein